MPTARRGREALTGDQVAFVGEIEACPKLWRVTLWITSKDGERDRVLLHAADDEAELRNLLSRSGLPYNLGWIEIDKGKGKGRRLIPYDHVASVETDS
jgi:hypothetical protein